MFSDFMCATRTIKIVTVIINLKLRSSLFSDLEAAHGQVIFITRVACETKDCERDWSRGQTGQC